MESIVEKLAEIEETAENIVEHAKLRKSEVEHEIQEKRNTFDRELDRYTKAEIEKIRKEAADQMEQALEEQRICNRSVIENLKKEYEEKHTAYAQEILKRITEV